MKLEVIIYISNTNILEELKAIWIILKHIRCLWWYMDLLHKQIRKYLMMKMI